MRVKNVHFLLVFCLISTQYARAELIGFEVANLVASNGGYAPLIVDQTLRSGWGIAIRPTANGLGGHFWISSHDNGTSNQYVGDVGSTAVYQDALKNIDVPPYTAGFIPPNPSGPDPFIPNRQGIAKVTGQTFQQTQGFITTLPHTTGTVVAPAKFLFATEDGVISAWTDNRQIDGTPRWVGYSTPMIDSSQQGSKYFGITVSNVTGNLYTADLGASVGIQVYGGDLSKRTEFAGSFNPFVGSDGFQPGEFAPFNIQTEQINGDGSLFVTFQKTVANPLNPTQIVPGMGQLGLGNGRFAEFAPDGSLLSIWDDKGLLNSPFGFAIAPSDFGLASNMVLVGNAGDGTIVAFDKSTKSAIDYLKDANGNALHIDGLKGLVFGNGMSLGEHDRLYFAAGPNAGADGLFGSISVSSVPEPSTWLLAGMGLVLVCARRKRARSIANVSISRYIEDRTTSPTTARTGFTLVELLVVIGIIGMLASLLLPAIQRAREAARTMQCESQIRQIGLALNNYHAAFSQYPTSTTGPGKRTGSSCSTGFYSWHASILPFVDQGSIYQSIDFGINMSDECDFNALYDATISTDHTNSNAASQSIPLFVCPSDPSRSWPIMGTSKPAPTSYTANIGWPPYTSGIDGERSPGSSSNGFLGYINPLSPNATHQGTTSSSSILDGLSNTVAVTERLINNLQDPNLVEKASDLRYVSFCAMGYATIRPMKEYRTCMDTHMFVDSIYSMPLGHAWISGWASVGNVYLHVLPPNKTNCHLMGGEGFGGHLASPSSNHVGGVNVLMADNRVIFQGNGIDETIWWAMGGRDDGLLLNE